MSIPSKIQILDGYDGKEVEFVNDVLLPVFRGMEFGCNFNHGAFELGKDIILRKSDVFGIPKYTAVVAKVGDIGNTSSKAKATLAEVERQVDQSWTTPFSIAEWKEKDKYVSSVIVVTSGNISNSAQAQIITKLTPYNKENTTYISQEMLISLLDKYYPDIWTSELPTLSRYLHALKQYVEKLTETENVTEQIHDLIATHCQKKIANPDPLEKQEKDSPLDVVGKGGKRIWFQGGTGSGKTFIVHNYARAAISSLKKENKKSGRYPVPIYLKAMWFNSDGDFDLKEIVKKSFEYIGVEVAELDIEAWLTNFGICVFYDELEMNSNQKLLDYLDIELKKLPVGATLVLLSRFMDENSLKLTFTPEVWHLKEINLSQASKALSVSLPLSNPKAKHVYREVIQGNMLEKLPRTPLAINILRKVFVDMELGKLPNNAFEFFDIFFEITLGKWEQKRDPSRPLDYKQVKAFLQSVAFRMVSLGKISIKIDEILDIADNLLKTTGQKEIKAKDYVFQIASFGEVCRITDDNFEFVQRTYQEFLAGCELKDHHWNIQELKENFVKINWEESIIFAAGGKQKDDALLSALASKEVRDFSERFSKLKNLGLVAQALYHSSVEAKAVAISGGAKEAISFRDDPELPSLLAGKNIQLVDLAFSFATLHMFSMFYGKHSLLTALEHELEKHESGRKPYYYAAAYSMLGEENMDENIFSNALKKLNAGSSPEAIAFGGFLENREKLLNRGFLKRVISGKQTKKFVKRTKDIVIKMRRKVYTDSDR